MKATPRRLSRDLLSRLGVPETVLAEVDRLGPIVADVVLPPATGGAVHARRGRRNVVLLDLGQLAAAGTTVTAALAHELGHADHGPTINDPTAQEAHAHAYADRLLCASAPTERGR